MSGASAGSGEATLPAGLADALHLMEPLPDGWKKWLVALLLLALLIAWLVWRRRQRRSPKIVVSPPPALPSEAPPSTSLSREIRRLRRRHRDTATRRQGCHELAELLREGLGQRWGRDLSTRTGREIGELAKASAVAGLFTSLDVLRFAPWDPGRRAFDEAFDSAESTVGSHAWKQGMR